MRRLPILMYHNISEGNSINRGLTISEKKLEEQIQFLISEKYNFLHFLDLEKLISIPEKSIVLTFDDITENQFFWALPLLTKYNIKATFFIPFMYIGKKNFWNGGQENIMSIKQLKNLDKKLIELGYHSYEHKKYSEMDQKVVDLDFELCRKVINKYELDVFPVAAYPYGNYPKKEPENLFFKETLKKNEIKFGLRIGNRLNKIPFKDCYEIERINIKGEDSLFKFKLKLKFGKLRLF